MRSAQTVTVAVQSARSVWEVNLEIAVLNMASVVRQPITAVQVVKVTSELAITRHPYPPMDHVVVVRE